MKSFFVIAGLLSSALALPNAKRQTCENSATSRSCWGDYDITTNYYDEAPDTGVIREYYFELQNVTVNADGFERIALTVNGTIPGPAITADWGDTVVVHLTNALANNGSSLHFHGIRQNRTSDQDGVASVTQCPTAPGDSVTYTWKATQYGSSWYHSHFFIQAWEGVFGPIIINGPASANYDTDLGSLALTDWSHQTIDQMYDKEKTSGPPNFDNILFNGKNTYQADVGEKFELAVTAGETYLLRLVNTAADNHMMFSIDNHTLTVISADFVPVEPFNVTGLPIGMGQRYEVVFTASEGSGNFWIRAEPQCTTVNNEGDLTAILRYDASSTENPTSTGFTLSTNCADLPISSLVPVVPLDAGDYDELDEFDVTLAVGNTAIKWYMNDITFLSQWKYPTTLALIEGNTTWTTDEHVIALPDANQWVYFVIESTLNAGHPIHLHGHDFYVLGQGTGAYSDSTVLTTTNPPRRDVAMLAPSGYLVIGFITDNPGVWLMHCHIAWHTSEGLALQLVERESEIVSTIDSERLVDGCENWAAYVLKSGVLQDDSGI